MRKLKNILLTFIPLLYLVFAIVSLSGKIDDTVCADVRVQVLDSLTNNFIGQNDILNMLNEEGIKLIGEPYYEINAQKVEDFIDKHPSILKSECYKTIGGVFRINILQRRPLIRVMGNSGNYYIDSNGSIMPFSKHYTAYVPVATGDIKNDLVTEGLYHLGQFLDENDFWRHQISQIEIGSESDITIVPRVGKHIIEFGKLENIDEKFSRLKALYEQKFNIEGWNRYKKISVKFENQVICTKK